MNKGEKGSKMPRKPRADRARAENLRKFTRKATVEEVPDEESTPADLPHPESHDTSNSWSCHNDEVDPDLDVIGALVDDEDESSELGSEDYEEEGEVPEIQEISALEPSSEPSVSCHPSVSRSSNPNSGLSDSTSLALSGHGLGACVFELSPGLITGN